MLYKKIKTRQFSFLFQNLFSSLFMGEHCLRDHRELLVKVASLVSLNGIYFWSSFLHSDLCLQLSRFPFPSEEWEAQ